MRGMAKGVLAAIVAMTITGGTQASALPTGNCSATFSGPTLIVTCTGRFFGQMQAVISHDTLGNILVNGSAVSGAPTLTNTDTVHVTGSDSKPDAITIDESNGRFEPGLTPDPAVDADDEIEFLLDLGSGAENPVTILGQATAEDNILLREDGIDVNRDGDADVTHSGTNAFTVDAQGSSDIISAAGLALSGKGPFQDRLTVDGGPGNDIMVAAGPNEVWNGGDGTDTLNGSGFAETLSGGPGNDIVRGSDGADVLDGGEGTDLLDHHAAGTATAGVTVDLASGSSAGGFASGDVIAGFEDVRGTPFSDEITGTAGRNLVQGGDGGDALDGGGGVDTLIYLGSAEGVSVDLVDGTGSGGDAEGDTFAGFENIEGSGFADHLAGSSGRNVLTGHDGSDTLDGRGGVDTLDLAHDFGPATVDLAAGTSTIDVSVTAFENVIGTSSADTLLGTSGPNVIAGGFGADDLRGRGGTDTLDYSGLSSEGVIVDLAAPSASGGLATGDTISGFENVVGSAFSDRLSGDDADNVLSGGGAKDVLNGRGGTDTLNGGPSSHDKCVNGETLIGCEIT